MAYWKRGRVECVRRSRPPATVLHSERAGLGWRWRDHMVGTSHQLLSIFISISVAGSGKRNIDT